MVCIVENKVVLLPKHYLIFLFHSAFHYYCYSFYALFIEGNLIYKCLVDKLLGLFYQTLPFPTAEIYLNQYAFQKDVLNAMKQI